MADKASFAKKLMRINERVVASNTPSAIFGSIGDLPQSVSSRARLRIGLFPCISDDEPEFAMGLWSVLAHLLESWRDIEVYRLFVEFEGDPGDFVWTIDKSQFTVADWDIENLDENIGLWGRLEKSESGWKLVAIIDNDNLTGNKNEAVELVVEVEALGALTAQLPAFAKSIADSIDAARPDFTDPAYPNTEIQVDDTLHSFLATILEWDANLLSTLWDVERDDDEFVDDFDDMLDTAKQLGNDFAAWLVAKAVAQTMRPGYSVIGDLFVDRVPQVAEAFDSNYAVPILAGAVFNMGFAPKAYRYLNQELQKYPQNTVGWLKLGEIQAEGGLLEQAIDTFQTAIENEAVNNHLFRAYANAMLLADRSGDDVTSFIMIDLKNEYDGNYVIWEAIEAFSEAMKLEEQDLLAVYGKTLQLTTVDYDQEYVWEAFVKLAEMDTEGDYVADVIENFYDAGDISQGVQVLEALIAKHPDRLDLYLNLAGLYIAGYEGESALPVLDKAEGLAKSSSDLADIERMRLTASDSEFEYRFGEVMSILDAGNTLQSRDVEFLENVVENAPHAIEGHIALGRSYYAWKEYDEALEVLLDAQEAFPNQPVVLDWLARILWESGERETAFTYLNNGIAIHPFNVQLISRAGRYLFDNAQLDEARAFLARAEEISPRHPMLRSVQAYIARQMAANPEKYKDI